VAVVQNEPRAAK